jgi:hypothetical protein
MFQSVTSERVRGVHLRDFVWVALSYRFRGEEKGVIVVVSIGKVGTVHVTAGTVHVGGDVG